MSQNLKHFNFSQLLLKLTKLHSILYHKIEKNQYLARNVDLSILYFVGFYKIGFLILAIFVYQHNNFVYIKQIFFEKSTKKRRQKGKKGAFLRAVKGGVGCAPFLQIIILRFHHSETSENRGI
jgi:hypothetical protein